MVSRPQYSIGELVARTGVPATTIHHYRSLGLLPAPDAICANRFVYDERHVQALRLVRLLRERRRLSLETIREVLPELLAVDEEAFRPEMWDQVVASHDATGTRAAIVAAARHAFAERGYADVNVGDVAEAVGVGKGTVYRHFASKEELFNAAAAAAVACVADRFDDDLDRAGGPRGDAEVEAVLVTALGPELPLLLELVNRGLRQKLHAREARTRFGDLAARVRRRLGPGATPERAEAVLERALARALRDAMGASRV
ncbi:MAG TPA: TetR family transcriptional regulator [Acidimicrobiia bacterium]|nr:TetR family transcriptional regulator [Acidimicrobiia bacterium]